MGGARRIPRRGLGAGLCFPPRTMRGTPSCPVAFYFERIILLIMTDMSLPCAFCTTLARESETVLAL